MKKLVLIAAVTIASATAFASKARLDALQNAAHLSDTEDIISKPDQAVVLPEFATLNFGDRDSAGQEAQGGITRKTDGAAWGLYLGDRPAANAFRAFDIDFLKMENNLNLLYAMDMGDIKWGVGLSYSSSNKKREFARAAVTGPPAVAARTLKDQKQDAAGIYASASSTAGWDAQLRVGLSNNASYTNITTNVENKMKGNTTVGLSGGYIMDTMYFYGSYLMAGAKYEPQTTANGFDRKDTTLVLGMVNSHKKDGTDFFYGAALSMVTQKDDGDATTTSLGANINKKETTTLPVILGVEHDAMSWLVIRGSITQNFLYSSDKVSTKNGVTTDGVNTVDDNTVVAAGLGLKFNKFILDGTFAKASDNAGAIGSDNNFLAKAALTYMF
ncbi:MAG: hypothetical protein ACK5WZ_05950 [Pseudobdellovibrionaceae bacterium]